MATATITPFPATGTSALATWALECFNRYGSNAQALHRKYHRNLDNFRGDNLELWKRGDARTEDKEGRQTHRRTHVNATQQKVMTMYSMLLDTTMSAGLIPFYLSMDVESRLSMDLQAVDDAQRRMGLMEGSMRAQHEKTKSDAHFMAAIFSGSLYGRGWLKKVIKPVKMTRFVPFGTPGMERWVKQEYVEDMPAWELRSVFNVFRDMEARELADGQRIFERYWWSAYDLRGLDGDGVITDAIGRVIEKARRGDYSRAIPGGTPATADDDPYLRDLNERDRGIRMAEMWGRMPRRQIDAFISGRNDFQIGEADESGDDAFVKLLLADDEVVRIQGAMADDNPMESFELERNLDWHDTGIADKCEHMQRVMNGLMNNTERAVKYLSAILFACKPSMIEKDFEEIEHGVKMVLNENARSVDDAIKQFVMQDVTQGAMRLMELVREFLDEDSMVSRAAQQGQSSGERVTAFEISTRVEAGDRYRGTIVRNIDEQLVEPLINWQLDWNLNDPAKAHLAGPYSVNANGMARYRNRTERMARLAQFMAMVAANEKLSRGWDLMGMSKEQAVGLDLDVQQYALSPEQIAQQEAMDLARMQAEAMIAAGAKARAQGTGNAMRKGVPSAPPSPPLPELPASPMEAAFA